MPTIESVNIQGFWGNHDVFIEFDPSVNFLVGVNGSGKTTAIDILASALQCDIEALLRLPFKKIEIVLFDKVSGQKPSVVVTNDWLDEGQFGSVRYEIKQSATSDEKDNIDGSLSLNDFEFGEYSHQPIRDPRTGRIIGRRGAPDNRLPDVREVLSDLIKMNWLSIDRVSSVRSGPGRRSNETNVQRKLQEISARLERYFSELSSKANEKTRGFQKSVFRSLIAEVPIPSLIKSLAGMDLQSEKEALIEIFKRFNIHEVEYSEGVKKLFDTLQSIRDDTTTEPEEFDRVSAMINGPKIHALVDEWNEVIEAEKKVLKPKEDFIKILNLMFRRKTATVMPSGEIVFETTSRKMLDITKLSSGEKQLFIILGEALLQKDSEWTYIADEPELSLHVDWQEGLVDNLRALNPNSQVIFATHSPDIISHYSDKVIEMEKVVR